MPKTMPSATNSGARLDGAATMNRSPHSGNRTDPWARYSSLDIVMPRPSAANALLEQ